MYIGWTEIGAWMFVHGNRRSYCDSNQGQGGQADRAFTERLSDFAARRVTDLIGKLTGWFSSH
jgi:hypothetical protein